MYSLLSARQWLVGLWLVLLAASLIERPLFPIDETRYVGVAWEMWARSDFLVPHLNGAPYSHKPPLLFWLMQSTWAVFGVNEWTARLVAPSFALASVFMTRSLAGLLWPQRPSIGRISALIMTGLVYWMIYSTLTMFDTLLVFFTLLAARMVWLNTLAEPRVVRWCVFGLAIGGGILSKGPVILLHVLPMALTAPWWCRPESSKIDWRRWYLGILLGVSVGAAVALSWAIPAGIAGGEVYRHAIWLGQTSGRLVKSFAHQQPGWWYLAFFPTLLVPWCFWSPFWQNLRRLGLQDKAFRFCLGWMLPVFVVFSLVSGKQLHYLLPLVPVLALTIARIADHDETDWEGTHRPFAVLMAVFAVGLIVLPMAQTYFGLKTAWAGFSPIWGVLLLAAAVGLGIVRSTSAEVSAFYMSAGALLTIVVLSLSLLDIRSERYDVRPISEHIADRLHNHADIAFLGTYHGVFNFYGRLDKGLPATVDPEDWADRHPDGYLVITFKDKRGVSDSVFEYSHPYRGRTMAIVSAKTLRDNETVRALLQ